MTARTILLALCVAVAACTAPAPAPRVEVERLASGDWRATWRAAEPVDTLRFVRRAGFLREREWRVVTPGYAFGREGDAQVLALAPDATAVDTVTVEFPQNTDFIERDYELFNTFTDGSVALFAGHFAAVVNGGATIDRVAVTAPPGQRALGDDYVYVGTIEPVEHERLVAIVDPGLPEWLAQSLVHYTPRVLDLYTTRTGHALADKPVVLFSFDPAAGGRSFNGGVVGTQLQLRVLGDGWRDDDPWAVRTALRLIAHEAAHLWNGHLARSDDDAPPWMHEGAAEAFADTALVALGIADDAALAEARTRALNDCIGGQRIPYACGQLAAWWTALAGGDLFAFWGDLIDGARATDGRYDEDDYFDALAARGASAATIAALRAFTAAPERAPAAALSAGLGPFGVSLVRDDAVAGRESLVRAGGAVVFAVLATDCTGGYGFYTQDTTLLLAGLGRCRTAQEGMRVAHIGPYELDAPGFAAAHYALDRCAAHPTIEIEGLEFSCPAELPALSGHWRIE